MRYSLSRARPALPCVCVLCGPLSPHLRWAGVRGGTRLLVWAGIGALLLSTVVIGVGNYLAA